MEPSPTSSRAWPMYILLGITRSTLERWNTSNFKKIVRYSFTQGSTCACSILNGDDSLCDSHCKLSGLLTLVSLYTPSPFELVPTQWDHSDYLPLPLTI